MVRCVWQTEASGRVGLQELSARGWWITGGLDAAKGRYCGKRQISALLWRSPSWVFHTLTLAAVPMETGPTGGPWKKMDASSKAWAASFDFRPQGREDRPGLDVHTYARRSKTKTTRRVLLPSSHPCPRFAAWLLSSRVLTPSLLDIVTLAASEHTLSNSPYLPKRDKLFCSINESSSE